MLTRCATVLAIAITMVLGSGQDVAAQGRAGGRGGGGGRGAPITPLTYRQTIMEQMQQTMSALTAIRNGTAGDPSHLLARATVVQLLAGTLPEAFAANVGGEGSRALPAIWETPTEFAARVQELRTAVDALVDAVRGGNAEAIGAAQTAAQQTCTTCHMQFRGPAPGA